MLSYVFSFLASKGVIGNSLKQSSPLNDHPLQKKPKINNNESQPYIPSSQHRQPALPADQQPPPPPSSLPPVQPYPVTQFMQSAGFSGVAALTLESYQNYQIEGGFYSQQSALAVE
ncbi:hypothetical protein HanIR_Chr07g0331001 [Helianthus annuus]|nr:hypothetical protein HanIR_Chr07g0331001 [Helianthus annuus]